MQRISSYAMWVATLSLMVFLALTPASAQGSSRDDAQSAVARGDYTTAARIYEELVKASPKDKGLLVEAGDVNMELERYQRARELYERALDFDSKEASINRKYALALSQLGDVTKAVDAARRAMKSDDGSLESYMTLGQVYLNEGKDSLNRAEITIISAREKYPDAVRPYVALGDLYFARGIYELAQTQYEEALQRDPNLIESRVKLARTYREIGARQETQADVDEFYNKSLLEFNKVTVLDSTNARAWLEQGEIFMLAKRYTEAGQSFASYVKLRPEDPRGDIVLARAAYGGNYYNEAIAPLERILVKGDSVSRAFVPQARVMLGKAYYAIKEFGKSAASYAQAPDGALDQEALKLYGSAILSSGGDTTAAIGIYRRLIATNPQDCEMSLSFAGLLYKMKRYDDVISVLQKRMADCPTESKATPYLYIGLSQYTLKRNDSAIAAFSEAIRADSAQFDPYYWLANAYAGQGKYDKVMDVVRVAEGRNMTAEKPDNGKKLSQIYVLVAFDAFKAKNYTRAIEQADRAAKADPGNSKAYLVAAYSYQSLSDKENACKYYRLVLKADPNNADAKKNMKALGCE
jgi:tetratricopeptide (TPR) repeat protein